MLKQSLGRRAAALVLAVAGVLGAGSAALAAPHPPTDGGNGGGQSGQCTGPVTERPHGCHTWK
ncbi:hypothetical protein GCM10017562_21030 [Streptomyces roseofulvus]|uniref:Chitinase n=2 Tax=Streptomyces TaxID=1883 RepID=A0ABU4K218_9ACTN|nr:hypothetical protein [Streptomyces roseolus]MDX2291589.1 hypothetical protein [Streptomyces roseolus]